jgi:hypothetical protein
MTNKALHVEYAISDKGRDIAFLEALYNTSFKRDYPMGVKLRFMGSIMQEDWQ